MIEKMMPKDSSSIFYLLGVVLPLLVFMSCSTSKNSVTTVKGTTISSGEPDTLTTNNEETPSTLSSFQSMTIGENQPIYSLDPLFATTFSEMQAIQLVYEGLVRFNRQGEIVPAIAKKWTISNHHRRFRFVLKDDVYYQNSTIFASGRGRKLKPSDIKKDFERMAQATVPSYAAQLFMNIRGFQPYFREQHKVFLASKRQFHGISGITIPNDSTIVFTLVHPDRHFLEKLASPYAVIYPPEATQGGHFAAVGTGPFKFSGNRSDSLYIFARFKNYHNENQPTLDRVNIVTSSHGKVLLKLMQQGYVDYIPALGPLQMAMVSRDDGKLKQSLTQKFNLLKPAERTASFRMRYNSGAILSEGAVVNTLSPLLGIPFFSGPPRARYTCSGHFPV